MQVELDADGHVRTDQGADPLHRIALAIVIALGHHRPVHEEQHGLDRHRGAEVVEQTGRTGRTTDAERLERLGVEVLRFGAGGAAEDLAMILADDRGATVIVTAGIHANLVEYLDGGRSSSASTFLARLRVGSKLIDAQAVATIHRPRVGLGLRRVTAGCFAGNEPSWRLMERVGMRREAHAVRDSLHRSRGWLDGLTYALLAEEWRDRS